MPQRDAAPPIVLAEFAVSHFTVRKLSDFRCNGINFASQGQEQVERNAGWEESNQKRMQIIGERNEDIQDQEHATGDHHGLREQLER